MKYSGNTAMVTMRMPVELLERLDQKRRDFALTRTTMVRTLLELSFLTPDELKEHARREAAMRQWFKSGLTAKPSSPPTGAAAI